MVEPRTFSGFSEMEADLIVSGKVERKERLLRVRKVAELLDVSRQMVYRYVDQGHLKTVKLPSGGLRIKVTEVQRFIVMLEAHNGNFGLQ